MQSTGAMSSWEWIMRHSACLTEGPLRSASHIPVPQALKTAGCLLSTAQILSGEAFQPQRWHRATPAVTALRRVGRAAGVPPAGRPLPAAPGLRGRAAAARGWPCFCPAGAAAVGPGGEACPAPSPSPIPKPRRPRGAGMWAASRGAASLEASMPRPARWWPSLVRRSHPLLVWFPC